MARNDIKMVQAKLIPVNKESVASDKTVSAVGVDPVVLEMTPALRRECAKLKTWLAAHERKDVLVRYRIAEVVRKVRDGGEYGARAVQQLEAALGFDQKSLYRWCEVAVAWPTVSSLKGVLSMTNARGLPLTWSHLELLAGLESQSRDRFMARALEEALSVRKLRQAIESEKPDTGAAACASEYPVTSSSARFDELVTGLDHAADVADGWQEVVGELVNQPSSPEVVACLEHALNVSKRLEDLAAGMKARVEGELQRLRQTALTLVAAPLANPIPLTTTR